MGKARRIRKKLEELPVSPKHIVLRSGKRFYQVGIFLIVLAVILSSYLLLLNDIEPNVILIAFLLFCLLGIYSIFHFYRWEIKIFGNEITERTIWRKVKVYDLEQIESAKILGISKGYRTMFVYAKEKRLFLKRALFKINEDSFGYNDFCVLLRSRNIPIKW